MSERNYEEAWEYTMKVLHDLYKSQNKEDEFKLWFNIHYVEDTIDTITVSVANNFLLQTMQKKGNLERIDIEKLAWRTNYPEGVDEMLSQIRNKAMQYLYKKDGDTYLFFDTETTGIPADYQAPSTNTDNWPRLVQIAWVLTDEKDNMINTANLMVRPDGFTIPTDAAKVHGITTEVAMNEGIPLSEAIHQFIDDLNTATYIVGHNIDFDKKIVGAEMIRLGLKDIMDSKKSYCTMQSSIDFCKIPGKYGYKYPKLQELYRKLFETEFDNAHDAMSDIEATEKCFWELRKRKLI